MVNDSNNIYFGQARKGIFNSKKASFSDWQMRCQEIREDYLSRKAARKAEIDGMADTWAQRVIDEKAARYALMDRSEAEEAKAEMLKNLEAIITEKEKKLSGAMKSPGTEAVETLSLLAMRTNLTPVDIVVVLPQVQDSLLGLQTLRDIANRNGVDFPTLPSVEEINGAIEKIRDFATHMIDSMESEDLTYMQRLFWTTDMPGLIKEQFDFLDNPSFLQIDAKGITAAKASTESAESGEKSGTKKQIATRVTLNGSEYLGTIARQFGTTPEAIRKMNPTLEATDLINGRVITVPGKLISDETGSGHISASTHKLEPVYAD